MHVHYRSLIFYRQFCSINVTVTGGRENCIHLKVDCALMTKVGISKARNTKIEPYKFISERQSDRPLGPLLVLLCFSLTFHRRCLVAVQLIPGRWRRFRVPITSRSVLAEGLR